MSKEYMGVILQPPPPSAYQYSTEIVESGAVNRITIGLPPDSQPGDGTLIVVQMLVKALLTEKGSNVFYPEIGCALLSFLGSDVTPKKLTELNAEIIALLDNILPVINNMQEQEQVQEEDIITEISLDEFNFSTVNTSLSIVIGLHTKDDRVPILVEL